MKKYKLVSKKGEGTFSEVVKAENIEDGKFYAIKCMKNSFKSLQQVRALSCERSWCSSFEWYKMSSFLLHENGRHLSIDITILSMQYGFN
jgi:serine/threonine protein kinase